MSEHFPYDSQVFSQTAQRKGISNEPTPGDRRSMELTASYMEVVRVLLNNNPITTTSWYRSAALNKKIGGSEKSQHSKGEAVDFTCRGFGTPLEICLFLVNTGLPFDQLIYEGSWVHISFVLGKARRRVLTAVFSDGPTTYVEGLDTGQASG